jgi:hypothetical protein
MKIDTARGCFSSILNKEAKMTSYSLKILAIITMIIDHIGFAFFPNAIILRLIGRISFPIFAFQLSVGYSHSKNKLKHIFTMLSFAIISQIPYMLFVSTAEESFALNIVLHYYWSPMSL